MNPWTYIGAAYALALGGLVILAATSCLAWSRSRHHQEGDA